MFFCNVNNNSSSNNSNNNNRSSRSIRDIFLTQSWQS